MTFGSFSLKIIQMSITRPSYHPLYSIWRRMINRCHNPKADNFRFYGAKGISVCDRWRYSLENFVHDMGPQPDGMTLDRFPDKKGNYEPGNVRWATWKQQARNT